MQTQTQASSADQIQFPVDDATYDLLQALTSKLEALDAYRTYMQDQSSGNAQLFQQLAQEDLQHAQKLVQALRQKLGSSR